MELIVDDEHPGTDERTWLSDLRLGQLRPLQVRRPQRLVIVAPHPDDEVLGVGGLLQVLAARGVEIVVLAVTDGEASHPGAQRCGHDLAAIRAIESRVALRRLECGGTQIERLRFADGSVAEHREDLTDLLRRVLRPRDLCLAPWRADGHPDHEATGLAAVRAARSTGTPVLEYLVWAWHWARPGSTDLPWDRCRRVELGRRQAARKRWASYAFASQIRPFGSDHGGRPLLSDGVLRRFWRPFEVFVEAEA